MNNESFISAFVMIDTNIISLSSIRTHHGVASLAVIQRESNFSVANSAEFIIEYI